MDKEQLKDLVLGDSWNDEHGYSVRHIGNSVAVMALGLGKR